MTETISVGIFPEIKFHGKLTIDKKDELLKKINSALTGVLNEDKVSFWINGSFESTS